MKTSAFLAFAFLVVSTSFAQTEQRLTAQDFDPSKCLHNPLVIASFGGIDGKPYGHFESDTWSDDKKEHRYSYVFESRYTFFPPENVKDFKSFSANELFGAKYCLQGLSPRMDKSYSCDDLAPLISFEDQWQKRNNPTQQEMWERGMSWNSIHGKEEMEEKLKKFGEESARLQKPHDMLMKGCQWCAPFSMEEDVVLGDAKGISHSLDIKAKGGYSSFKKEYLQKELEGTSPHIWDVSFNTEEHYVWTLVGYWKKDVPPNDPSFSPLTAKIDVTSWWTDEGLLEWAKTHPDKEAKLDKNFFKNTKDKYLKHLHEKVKDIRPTLQSIPPSLKERYQEVKK